MFSKVRPLLLGKPKSTIAAVHAAVAPFEGAKCVAASLMNMGKQIQVPRKLHSQRFTRFTMLENGAGFCT